MKNILAFFVGLFVVSAIGFAQTSGSLERSRTTSPRLNTNVLYFAGDAGANGQCAQSTGGGTNVWGACGTGGAAFDGGPLTVSLFTGTSDASFSGITNFAGPIYVGGDAGTAGQCLQSTGGGTNVYGTCGGGGGGGYTPDGGPWLASLLTVTSDAGVAGNATVGGNLSLNAGLLVAGVAGSPGDCYKVGQDGGLGTGSCAGGPIATGNLLVDGDAGVNGSVRIARDLLVGEDAGTNITIYGDGGMEIQRSATTWPATVAYSQAPLRTSASGASSAFVSHCNNGNGQFACDWVTESAWNWAHTVAGGLSGFRWWPSLNHPFNTGAAVPRMALSNVGLQITTASTADLPIAAPIHLFVPDGTAGLGTGIFMRNPAGVGVAVQTSNNGTSAIGTTTASLFSVKTGNTLRMSFATANSGVCIGNTCTPPAVDGRLNLLLLQVGAASAVINFVGRGTVTTDFAPEIAGPCTQRSANVTVTGASVASSCRLGYGASGPPAAGLGSFFCQCTAANTCSVGYCGAGAVPDPPSIDFILNVETLQ